MKNTADNITTTAMSGAYAIAGTLSFFHGVDVLTPVLWALAMFLMMARIGDARCSS
jgi:hypothetical protein